jgi:hypothetical protein
MQSVGIDQHHSLAQLGVAQSHRGQTDEGLRPDSNGPLVARLAAVLTGFLLYFAHCPLTRAADPSGCVETALQSADLRSADITSPKTYEMLLANIMLVAQSHWLEREDFYQESFLKKLFGAGTIKRQALSTPGSELANMPPGTFEDFEIFGRLATANSTDRANGAKYQLGVTKAKTGELADHVVRQLRLSVVAPGLSLREVKDVWGFGVPPPKPKYGGATDGGTPPGTLIFYKCERADWVETLDVDFYQDFVLRLSLDVTRQPQ